MEAGPNVGNALALEIVFIHSLAAISAELNGLIPQGGLRFFEKKLKDLHENIVIDRGAKTSQSDIATAGSLGKTKTVCILQKSV